MNQKTTVLFALGWAFFFVLPSAMAQKSVMPELSVKRLQGAIKLDGLLNDAAWQQTDYAGDFWQYFPMDTSRSRTKTEVRIAYNDEFLYVGFKVSDPEPGGYVTTSLRRDFRGIHNDVITVVFDPFRDQTNGIFFGINPFGVQREGLISGNAGFGNGFDLSWDNKWYGQAKIHEGYWTAEMAIPFKTLRYQDGDRIWNANFYRLDSKSAERSTWGNIPRNQSIISMAFPGKLVFDDPPPKPGANIALIPYTQANVARNFDAGESTIANWNVGGDAKIGITPSLNLDLTVNPDFSQVEVDVQQTNLTRFELFFPERRQFFLENADIFASFGNQRMRPFFSRRIGLAVDPATGLTVQNPINFGARLSGRLDENWRLGVMNMQAAKDAAINLPGFNYSVLALQRQLFARSNVSAIFINKQAAHKLDSDSTLVGGWDANNYNRVVGLDYNLASDDNKWNGKFFFHKSFDDTETGNQDFAHGVNLTYNVPWLQLEWNHQVVGKDYNPEVGFVPRKDFYRVAPEAQFAFYPNKKVVSHGPGIATEYTWNDTYGKTDHLVALTYSVNFNNNAELFAAIQQEYTYLFADFDPIRSGKGEPLPEGSEYEYISFVGAFESDQRKDLFYSLEGQFGQFFEGSLFSVQGDLNYRYDRFGVAALNFAYSRIDLPEPFPSGDLILLGPRIDMTFTKNLFLTTFFQYNNQIENVNINARLQYRFKPVSDFFLVYTDNYYSTDFRVKNRAIVAKLTYWLNL